MPKVKGKLTDKQKKQIIADYVECGNYSAVSRKYGISDTYVKKIVKSNEECSKMLEQKKEENMQSMLEYLDTLNNKKKKIISKLLDAIESKAENIDNFTNVKDVASAYGILIDKELKISELRKQPEGTEIKKVLIVNDLPKDNKA